MILSPYSQNPYTLNRTSGSNQVTFKKYPPIAEEQKSFYTIKNIFNNPRLKANPIIEIPDKNGYGGDVTIKTKIEGHTQKTLIFLNSKQLAVIRNVLAQPVPQLDFEMGKFGINLVVTDPQTNIKLIMDKGSILKAKNFDINFPIQTNNPSFYGDFYFINGYKKDKTYAAADQYFTQKLYNSINPGKYSGQIEEDYSYIIFSGGEGTRLKNISKISQENKTSTDLPAEGYKLIHNVMDRAYEAGVITNKTDKTIHHINEVKPGGSAAGLLLAISNNQIPLDKSAIINNGDIFCNFDLSKTIRKYELLQKHPTKKAGLIFLGYPVNKEDMKRYGIIGTQEDNTVSNFISLANKKDPISITQAAKEGRLKDTKNYQEDMYNANAGIWIIHPQFLKAINILGEEAAAQYAVFNFDHLANILIELCNKDILTPQGSLDQEKVKKCEFINKIDIETLDKALKTIKDTKGHRLKVYGFSAEARDSLQPRWGDIGTFNAYLETSRDIVTDKYKGISNYLVAQAKDNVDLQTGITYIKSGKVSMKNFKEQFEIQTIRGNILVSSL